MSTRDQRLERNFGYLAAIVGELTDNQFRIDWSDDDAAWDAGDVVLYIAADAPGRLVVEDLVRLFTYNTEVTYAKTKCPEPVAESDQAIEYSFYT